MTLPLPPFYDRRHLDETDSTNDRAKALAVEGAREGTLVTARRQTAGRGRRGNVWESLEGNLFLSLVLRPRCPAADSAQLSFVLALAVAEVARSFLPAAAITLKWPNDVFCNGRKLCGILLEAGPVAAGRATWVVAGVGINVAHGPAEGTLGTSLRGEGAARATAESALAAFATAFLAWYSRWIGEGFPPIRTAWLAQAHGLRQAIRVRLTDEIVDARFDGIDDSGALLAGLADGTCRRVTGGEVHFGTAS